MSQLYCPQLPPDKIIDPKTIDKKSAKRELRKERLRHLIEACLSFYGFYFDGFAVAAGLIKTTGGGVCVQGFDGVPECMDTGFRELYSGLCEKSGGVGERMDTGFRELSYKNILIRQFTETSNDAGSVERAFAQWKASCQRIARSRLKERAKSPSPTSVSYGEAGHSKEYANDRDVILAELGAKEARVSVIIDGVWRPFKIWGDIPKAKAFFYEVEKQKSDRNACGHAQAEEEKARKEYIEEVRRELDEEFSLYKDNLDR